jgi:DNA-binding beta-propeller fold protein YncE
MSKPILVCLLVLGVACSFLASACGAPELQITSTPVPALAGTTASFDNIEIDQASHRLYVADRTDKGIDVFDISTAAAKYMQTVPLPSSPNGMAIAPDLALLFVGTAAGSVAVIDIKTNSPTLYMVTTEVPTGGTAVDLLDYDATQHLVYAGNGSDGTIRSIDAKTNKIKASFTVGQPVEQPRFNKADGMLYVTSPIADALFQIDPSNGTIKNKFPLAGCQPTGLAINPTSNQALIACRAAVMSWDLRTGKSHVFNDVAGGDIVSYNAKVDRFLVGSPHKTRPSVVGIFGRNPISYVASAATAGSGNSAAYDETNDAIYTPDTRRGSAGVASFSLSASQTPLSYLPSLSFFAVLLAVVALLFYFVGRSADPVRRREPEPRAAADRSVRVKAALRSTTDL